MSSLRLFSPLLPRRFAVTLAFWAGLWPALPALHAAEEKPVAAYRADAATPPPSPETQTGGYWKKARAPEGPMRTGNETIQGKSYNYITPNPLDGNTDHPDSFGSFQFLLIPESFSDADGWTATAVVRVLKADSLNLHSCSFRIFDGEREYMLSIFNDPKRQQTGLVLRKAGMTLNEKAGYARELIPFDVESAYHTYQIYYDPRQEKMMLYVDGRETASLPRNELVENTEISGRIRWGKETAKPGEARWNEIRFEKGKTIIPEK